MIWGSRAARWDSWRETPHMQLLRNLLVEGEEEVPITNQNGGEGVVAEVGIGL